MIYITFMAENDNANNGSENQPNQPAGDEALQAAPETVVLEITEEQAADNAAAMEEESRAGVAVPENNSPDNPLRVLEALLFASDEILTTDRIKAIVPGIPDARKIRQMVDKINEHLAKERHPFEVVEIGGGYQFRTVSYYYPWVVQLFKEKAARKLSIQSLECLAIISYKQPITKAEIESIRGVMSDGAMKTLLEKRLVTISGRSDKAGRPLLYATTKEFLAYFGINKIADLPRIEEFEAMAKEKLGDLTETELTSMETEKAAAPDSADRTADDASGQALPATPGAPEETVALDQGDLPQDAPQPPQRS
ncbi:MAG TPA: SMC-Scp complex subunit ScpB [Chitinivibrionales bacterium]|nr:SMC-Scp complex subunit ScpB [Chitinivibrionales bacterium]